MALSKKHRADVCVVYGGHKQCRYLEEIYDMSSGEFTYMCKKLSPDRDAIDDDLVEIITELAKKGQDPTDQGVPMGNNCKGYPYLITKEQGYDVKE